MYIVGIIIMTTNFTSISSNRWILFAITTILNAIEDFFPRNSAVSNVRNSSQRLGLVVPELFTSNNLNSLQPTPEKWIPNFGAISIIPFSTALAIPHRFQTTDKYCPKIVGLEYRLKSWQHTPEK
mmetsp:Transcript_4403/g.6612  ORF Transcript_4403/g.6612 Transcript_4403/m.6612 type:complete len:125 (-) Transcript_4403:587-961(-)